MGVEIPIKPFPHGKPFTKEGEPQTVAELLRRTRVVLSPRGAWYSSGWKGNGGARCTAQAIRDSDGKLVAKAEGIVLRAIREKWPGYNSIPQWNDAPKRTKTEVLGVLDRAIEIAEKEEK